MAPKCLRNYGRHSILMESEMYSHLHPDLYLAANQDKMRDYLAII